MQSIDQCYFLCTLVHTYTYIHIYFRQVRPIDVGILRNNQGETFQLAGKGSPITWMRNMENDRRKQEDTRHLSDQVPAKDL